MDEFISEDDLHTFEGWLKYLAIDATAITQDELTTWRRLFEDAKQRSAANPKVGLMKLQPVPVSIGTPWQSGTSPISGSRSG